MENLNKRDPYLMLSLLNTKLRDECEDFEDLCKTYDLDEEETLSRMDCIGYTYQESTNQFVAAE